MLAYYQSEYEELEERIQKVEESALRNDNDDFLADLLRLKRYVFLVGRLADQHKTVFAAFTRPDFDLISGNEVEPYFKDLQQRLSQLVDRLIRLTRSCDGSIRYICVPDLASHEQDNKAADGGVNSSLAGNRYRGLLRAPVSHSSTIKLRLMRC